MTKYSLPSDETMERLAEIVGARNALREEEAMAPFVREWRERYVGKAAMVLKPGSTAEVSQILKLAEETRTAIVPQGGNTGLVGGQVPHESGHEVLLSLSRLNRITEMDPNGYTMTVEAGAILADVQNAAEAADRLFPLSLASESSCQIGGNLSANAGGVGVLAYGNMRDLTLGIEVVLAGGRVWDGLKKLRKDNSGYDLRDLFIGSEGTLGIITGAVLKLFPRPKDVHVIFAGLADINAVGSFFDAVLTAFGRSVTAFELLPRIGLEFVKKHAEGRDPFGASYPWYVLVELSEFSSHKLLTGGVEPFLADAIESGQIVDAVIAQSGGQAKALWQLRDRMSEAQKLEGSSIKHDVSVPTATIAAFIRKADDLVQKIVPGARPVAFGHFGDGNVHYNISQPSDMDGRRFLDRWDEVNEVVYGLALDLGGSISAEHGIGRMKKDFLAKVKDPLALEMMQDLKRSLDPHGIMNPGKVL